MDEETTESSPLPSTMTSSDLGEPEFDSDHQMASSGLEPKFPASVVWKSDHAKEEEKFERIKRLVSYIAPKQVRGWKPTTTTVDTASILPLSFREYLSFRAASLENKAAEWKKHITFKEEELKRRRKITVDSIGCTGVVEAFRGKHYEDGRGPVFAQYTIWSKEWTANSNEESAWPSQEAMKESGDMRKSVSATAECQRKLPHLVSDPSNITDVRNKDSPLDMIERHLTPYYKRLDPDISEIERMNRADNDDKDFELWARHLLGGGLLLELDLI